MVRGSTPEHETKSGPPGRLIYALVGLATVTAILVAWRVLPVEEAIGGFANWMSGRGIWGIAAFVLIYVATVLAIGPAWAMSASAGVAFGLWAVPLVLLAATTGAVIGFSLARRLGRARVSAYIRDRPRIDAIDQAVRLHGFRTVVLLRLSPFLPFGAKNYVLGLTAVPARSYALGTLIGIIPGTSFYVYLGTIGRIALESPPRDLWEWLPLLLGLVATGTVVLLISRAAQRRLRELGI